MRIFGFEITRVKANPIPMQDAFRPVWWPVGSTINESYPGAWQHNQSLSFEDTLSYWAVFRCIAIIAGDIAKLRLKLVQKTPKGIWQEVDGAPHAPVLRKPNRYQNRIQFVESWMNSKLSRGNTYVLKQRDARQIVTALYILDPSRVKPYVSEGGEVFYQLDKDNLSELKDNSVLVPASEIIHDRWNTLYHPLCGLSPITAAGLSAISGLNIQKNSAQFFANNSQPGGVLTAPSTIPDATAQRLKEEWIANYSGKNVGRVAVLGDGLTYQAMAVTAIDAQLIEQLKWSAETVAGAFGVPAYMLNIGGAPSYNNVEALNTQYYSQCLQVLIESFESCLDEGLALPSKYATQFDLAELLQMDTATKVKAEAEGIKAGFRTPNEARAAFNLPPVKGGDTPYLQQQNFSLAALDKRDQQENPFGSATPPAAPAEKPETSDEEEENGDDTGGSEDKRAKEVAELERRADYHYVRYPA